MNGGVCSRGLIQKLTSKRDGKRVKFTDNNRFLLSWTSFESHYGGGVKKENVGVSGDSSMPPASRNTNSGESVPTEGR